LSGISADGPSSSSLLEYAQYLTKFVGKMRGIFIEKAMELRYKVNKEVPQRHNTTFPKN
jgi:hypothetical protein